jgi:hypothetical protein
MFYVLSGLLHQYPYSSVFSSLFAQFDLLVTIHHPKPVRGVLDFTLRSKSSKRRLKWKRETSNARHYPVYMAGCTSVWEAEVEETADYIH